MSLLTALNPTTGSTSRIFISSSLKDKRIAIQFDQTRTLIIGEEDLRTRMSPHIIIISKSFSAAPKAQLVKAIPLLPSALSIQQMHTISSIRSLSRLHEVLGTTLPSLQQKSTQAAQDVEKCRLSIVDSARRAGAVNEEVFRARLISWEGSIWAERVEIKNLAELVKFVGGKLRRKANEINDAYETIVKVCLDGFVGYTNAADVEIPFAKVGPIFEISNL